MKGTTICIITEGLSFQIYRNVSFMKMLKSRDPRIDACGTPAIIISHSLNESLISQLWYLFEAVFKLRPPALSFAARR